MSPTQPSADSNNGWLSKLTLSESCPEVGGHILQSSLSKQLLNFLQSGGASNKGMTNVDLCSLEKLLQSISLVLCEWNSWSTTNTIFSCMNVQGSKCD